MIETIERGIETEIMIVGHLHTQTEETLVVSVTGMGRVRTGENPPAQHPHSIIVTHPSNLNSLVVEISPAPVPGISHHPTNPR